MNAPRKRGRPAKTGKKPRVQQLPGDDFDTATRRLNSIREYWAAKGYTIVGGLKALDGHIGRYEVKTDMVAGMPRDYRPPGAKPVARRLHGGGITSAHSYRDIFGS